MYKRTEVVLSGFLVVLGGFLIFYAYYLMIGLDAATFFRFKVGLLDQWMPVFFVAGFVSFVLGLVITYKTLKMKPSKLANAMLSGSLVVFSCSLIFEAYHLLIGYYLTEFLRFRIAPLHQWMPVFFVAGFVSFVLGLVITYKTLKMKPSKLAKTVLSAILIVTGSFLIFDAHRISTEYYQVKDIIDKQQFYHYFDSLHFKGLKATYTLLPFYVAVSLIIIAFGLITAYKALKTKK